MDQQWQQLIKKMQNGSELALSRLITRVENRKPGWMEAMEQIYPGTGNARMIGITGSPGAGKSTLTDWIARCLIDKGKKVGIIAVDPSSPFSGGALLGDRIRMRDSSTLENVFVRSMATRGALGGLNQSARDVAKIMDAFGKDYILIETVGVGQDEVEVVRTADLVLVICVPGQGDAIQAVKAGIMEIADLFIVNKSDREGADQVVADIQSMLDLGPGETSTKPPILKTSATTGEGIAQVVEKMMALANSLSSKNAHQKERIQEELIELLKKEVADLITHDWQESGQLDEDIRQIIERKNNPYAIVQKILVPLTDLFQLN